MVETLSELEHETQAMELPGSIRLELIVTDADSVKELAMTTGTSPMKACDSSDEYESSWFDDGDDGSGRIAS
jgi:hypothetical protein